MTAAARGPSRADPMRPRVPLEGAETVEAARGAVVAERHLAMRAHLEALWRRPTRAPRADAAG